MSELINIMQPLLITDTILRDAHQSHAATRMRLEDMLPACEVLDSIGFWSLECWGGATFDTCMRYLEEDPWKRLRALRQAMPHTKLQMLLRGQNLLGYRHYADDVVDSFCGKSIENGIDVVRIFDALNDERNMETAMQSVKRHGGLAEAALSYTTSPIHSEQYFIEKAKILEQMGADIICIKDMANLLLPEQTFRLIKQLKKNVSVPIHLHTHDTTGTGSMVYLAATMAGVDIVDCALSPFANGTSQPATETIVAAMAGTSRDTGLNLGKLNQAAEHFVQVRDKMIQEGRISCKVLQTNPGTRLYQVPGGMFSNLLSQLQTACAESRLNEVLAEIPIVRADFGYPPLVTPTSQIVGTQAVLNVLAGRYHSFTKESKALLRGEYGALPGPVNEKVRKMALADRMIISCRPADLLEPELEKNRKQFGDIIRSEEDLLSCTIFPQIAPDYIRRRDGLVAKEIQVKWLR